MLPAYKASLHERLVNTLGVSPRPGIEEVYREVINVLRQYSVQAVVLTSMREIQGDIEDRADVVQRLPWLHLLLVKWALQDKRIGLTFGPRHNFYTQDVQRRLVHKLWNVSPRSLSVAPSPGVLYRHIRRTMHVQFEFQRYTDVSFLRWPALLERLPNGHPARNQFEEAMGMPPRVYAELSTAVLSIALGKSSDSTLDLPTLSSLHPHYGSNLVKFLELFARKLHELRIELQAEPASRTRGFNELYEFPYLQRFPILDLGDGQLRIWHPLVFSRGLENAAHLRLSALGERYTRTYSRLFEDYVVSLAKASFPDTIAEADYRDMHGGAETAVEAAIPFGTCNVFVEAKMSLFHDRAILEENPTVLRHQTKNVRKAIEQGTTVSKTVREAHSPLKETLGNAPTDYMLVVTSRELLLVTAERMQQLMPDEPLLSAGITASEHLPQHQIFIIDINDYELVMANVASGKVRLPDLLRHAAKANLSHADGRMQLSEHIGRSQMPHRIAPLLASAFKEAQQRVEKALGFSDRI